MAFILADRVRETSTAPGTGSFTMNGAVQGAQSFASVLTSNADTTWYAATNGTAWETGLLTRTSASVYARTTIFASSNAGSAVNFASGAVDVFIDLPASRIGLQSKTVLVTRDPSVANSSVAYTGVGFKPTALVFQGLGSGIPSAGIADSARTAYSVPSFAAGAFTIAAGTIQLYQDATNSIAGTLTSYDADGFTISWVKTGAPASTTFYLAVLCLR